MGNLCILEAGPWAFILSTDGSSALTICLGPWCPQDKRTQRTPLPLPTLSSSQLVPVGTIVCEMCWARVRHQNYFKNEATPELNLEGKEKPTTWGSANIFPGSGREDVPEKSTLLELLRHCLAPALNHDCRFLRKALKVKPQTKKQRKEETKKYNFKELKAVQRELF